MRKELTRLFVVYLALIAFLALTVALSFTPSPFNSLFGLLIAFTKASLVLLFFMELRKSSNLIKLVSTIGPLWLLLLFLIASLDLGMRV
ncbi:MAG: cytochrome C oxidase subunit IV family protein [Pseudobdellovibrionaceae bacterium]